MKTVLALTLTSVLFISQTLTLAYATENQGSKSLLSSKDFRLKLANEVEAKGEYLQRVADVYGEEAAALEFDRMTQQNLTMFIEKNKEAVAKMSESEAETHLAKFSDHVSAMSKEVGDKDSERIASIISDRTLSAKEKVVQIYSTQSAENFQGDIAGIKEQIHSSGYKKAFSDLASQMRSRTHDDHYSDGDDAFFVVLLVVLLLAVILAAATTDVTYVYVVGGCGGYGYYHYYGGYTYYPNSDYHYYH